MTVILTLPDDFTIETYSGLKDFLEDHLQLDEGTVEQLPNLIRLAEYRLDRMLLTPARETTTTLSTTAGTQSVALPTDFRQARQVKIEGDNSTGYPLAPVTPNVVETQDVSGKPQTYAIVGSNLLLGPVPDSTYVLTLTYVQRLPPLTEDAPTNWLLTQNADAYIWMACAVIEKHLGNVEGAALYVGLAEGTIEEINQQGIRYRNSAPMRLRSPVVV